MRNAEVLADLADPTFQTELGQFNLELNAPPRLIAGDGFADYEQELLDSAAPGRRAGRASTDARLVLIGILPTLTPGHAVLDNLSANPRYRLLNEQIVERARRGHHAATSAASSGCDVSTDSIAPEAACTSVQFHLQVPPERVRQLLERRPRPSPGYRSRSAPTRRSCSAASSGTRPGSRCSSRPPTPARTSCKAQGVRPRVWFGERWITSIFDLFEENVRYFPPLLPICDDEDPVEVLPPAAYRAWPSCGCTTAPSTAGTGRSTTS